MRSPEVQFLWWSECPSWEQALAGLRSEMEALGLDPGSVDVREIDGREAAERERFVGSPTIRIDGRDIDDPTGEPAGLTCRVYRMRDGRISPVPDPADVRDALIEATEGG